MYKDGKKVRELKSNNFIHEDNDKVKKMTDEARDNLAKQICDKRDKNKRTYKKKHDKRRKDELNRGADEKE